MAEQAVLAKALKRYANAIHRQHRDSQSGEHAFRPTLIALIEKLTGYTLINEPKYVACGSPDIVAKHYDIAKGFIETKAPGTNLDKAETSEQITRYREALGCLVLTDFAGFRLYVDGEPCYSATILTYLEKPRKWVLAEDAIDQFACLLHMFVDNSDKAPAIRHAKPLAERMANCARQMKLAIVKALELEKQAAQADGKDLVDYHQHNLLEGFRQILVHNMTEEDYADMFAQTVTYGLFSSRLNENHPNRRREKDQLFHERETFTRLTAARNMPPTNPFLARAYVRLTGADLDERLTWIADELASILDRTDMDAIKAEFIDNTHRGDPVIYFYEHFLDCFDPNRRRRMGVYYTPRPVIDYIVKSIDKILIRDFDLEDGLAATEKTDIDGDTSCHRVQILDPAVGTGSFLDGVMDKIRDTVVGGQEGTFGGLWPAYVKEHLIPRFNGFEFLMAPHAIANIRLTDKLTHMGAELSSRERLNIYLTNTLEEPHEHDQMVLMHKWLTDEARAATAIKRDCPVMVILGNPPYAGHSSNPSSKPRFIAKGDLYETYDAAHKKPGYVHARQDIKARDQRTFAGHLLRGFDPVDKTETQSYYHLDDAPLGEKNSKWLDDDYVKFIRFAQWRIERTGAGVIGFVVNNGFLDNPTFRAMRKSLMDSFDHIYLVDMHGNAKKKETAPDGGRDENVFNIMVGTCILIMLKKAPEKSDTCQIFHTDLWGPRRVFSQKDGRKQLTGGKFHWLSDHDVTNTRWQQLTPSKPDYLFVPRDEKLRAEYDKGWPVRDIMAVNVLGFQSHRDHFAIAFDEATLEGRVKALKSPAHKDRDLLQEFTLKESAGWTLKKARSNLHAIHDPADYIGPCAYRPFDNRAAFFHRSINDRPRPELMDHVFKRDNLVLCISRQQAVPGFRHVLITNQPPESCLVSNKTREGNQCFPLYLYPAGQSDDGQGDLMAGMDRTVNLSPAFCARLEDKTGLAYSDIACRGDLQATMGPEDILAYIYAVLYAPAYRQKYVDFLKSDFPRIPVLDAKADIIALMELGRRLLDLHLMRRDPSDMPGFPTHGNNEVAHNQVTRPFFDDLNKRVHINETQYFAPVEKAVWEEPIGGYAPAQKWLKDRSDCTLDHGDIKHYSRLLGILAETPKIMSDIDRIARF